MKTGREGDKTHRAGIASPRHFFFLSTKFCVIYMNKLSYRPEALPKSFTQIFINFETKIKVL